MPISGTAKAVRVPVTTSGGGTASTTTCTTDDFTRTVSGSFGAGPLGAWVQTFLSGTPTINVNGTAAVVFETAVGGLGSTVIEQITLASQTLPVDILIGLTITAVSSTSFIPALGVLLYDSSFNNSTVNQTIRQITSGIWACSSAGITGFSGYQAVTMTSGEAMMMRANIAADGVRTRVWPASGSEPGTWTATDLEDMTSFSPAYLELQINMGPGDTVSIDTITVCLPATVTAPARPYRGVKVYGNLGTGIWTTVNAGSQVTLGNWLVGWDTDGYMRKNDLGAQNPVIPSGMGGYYEVTMNIQVAERTPVPTTGMVQLDLFAQDSASSTVLSRQMYYGFTEWQNDLGYVTDMRLKWNGYLADGAWVTGTLLNYFDSTISLNGGVYSSASWMELRYLGQDYGSGGDNIHPQYGLIAVPPVTFVDGFNRTATPTTTWTAGGASPLGTSSAGVGWVAGPATPDGLVAVGVTNSFYSPYMGGLATFKGQTGVTSSTVRHGINCTGSPLSGSQQWTMVLLFAWHGAVGTSTFVVARDLSGGNTQAAVEIASFGNFLIDSAGNVGFGSPPTLDVWYYVKLQNDPVAQTLQVRMWAQTATEPATWDATRSFVTNVAGPEFYIEATLTSSTAALYVDSVWVFPGLI